MDIRITKNHQIANSYYNLGLEKAKRRDLTGAAEALKRALRFNKFHTDARNLLGLIYDEIGEAGAAMSQWVLSLNLQEQDNMAEEYLREVQGSQSYLKVADQAAKKFNQSLIYAQNDNEDLAVLLLMRMLSEFPYYLKAQLLLALLYMQYEDFTKAGRCLYQVLKVDKFNPLAQRYMAIVKENTGRAEIEKRKIKNAFSHRQMEDDDIIIPPSYRENTGWQSILNILTGLAMGAAVIFFLVMPTNREALNVKHNKELQLYMEQLNQSNITIDDLNRRMTEADQAKQTAEQNLENLLSDNGGVLKQYQTLIQILDAYRQTDMRTAAFLYTQMDVSILNDETIQDSLIWLAQEMTTNGWQVLQQMGNEAFARQDGTAQAIDYYQRSLQLKGDNPQVIYQLGLTYKSLGDTDTANQYFGDVIMNYSDSEYAAAAQEQRGY